MGGIVRAVLVGDGVIYAGGDFTSVNTNTTPVTRNRIAAIDPVYRIPDRMEPGLFGLGILSQRFRERIGNLRRRLFYNDRRGRREKQDSRHRRR